MVRSVVLFALGGFCLLFLTCGTPPPVEHFSGTKDDSLQVRSIAETTAVFKVTVFEGSLLPLDSAARDFLWQYARRELVRTQAKFLPVAIGRRVVDTIFSFDTLMFVKDTTATVVRRQELIGDLMIRICSITPPDTHPDSIGRYEKHFIGKDTTFVKRWTAATWEWGHFEPIKKDTAFRTWRLLKVSGCQIISIPDPENSAIIHRPAVLTAPGRVCSVFPLGYYRRDSLNFGDRRLFFFVDTACAKKDSLLYFTGGGRLTAEVKALLNMDDTASNFLKFLHRPGERKEAGFGITLPTFEKPTFTRLYLDVLHCKGLVLEKERVHGIIWGVATKVK